MRKILILFLIILGLGLQAQVIRPTVNAGTLGGHPASWFLSTTGTAANSALWMTKDTNWLKAGFDYFTLHSTFTSAPLLGKTTQKTFNDAVDGYIMNYRTAYQGLAWNESTDLYQRLGSLAGLATGSSPGNGNLPIQSKMRGCVLNVNGTVNYYLSDFDWNYKADGTASNLTGADGNVMVEIPAFYYKYQKVGNWNQFLISLYQLPGYSLHPAFTKDGVDVAYRYISAYEGSLYDVSASLYANGLYLPADTVTFAAADSTITIANVFPTNGFSSLAVGDRIVITGTTNNNTTYVVKTIGAKAIHVTVPPVNETANATVISTERDYTATTGDKLVSVSGKVPITQLTRAQSRVIAKNNGTGWRQLDYDLVHAIELLMLVEYGTFYIQNIAEVGPGITNVTGWTNYNNSNPFASSGNGNTIGNASGDNAGATSISTEKTKYSRYRGISNFYGYIYKWVDGININAKVPYVTNNSAAWGDDTSTGYTDLGVTLSNGDGYQKTLVNSSRVMLPAVTSGASASTFITDYYYQSTGWRVAFFGGSASDGASAGAWDWFLSSGSGIDSRSIGARISY